MIYEKILHIYTAKSSEKNSNVVFLDQCIWKIAYYTDYAKKIKK